MAAKLVKCGSCSNDVSTDAAACPRCGAPVKKKTSAVTIVLGVLGGLFAMCVLLGVLGRALGDAPPSAAPRTGQGSPAAASAPAPAAPAIAVTPRELANAYVENEVAADERFKGKMVRLTGNVESISKDIMDTPYLVLRSGQVIMRQVQCYFDDDQVRHLAKLKPGEKVVVDGRVEGLMGNVLIKDARFAPEGSAK